MFPGYRMVDLTQKWNALTPTWPYFPSSKQWNFHSHHKDGVQSVIIETNMHSGTHVDAPLHFSPWGPDMASIPLERLVGPTVIVDISDLCTDDFYLFSADDIRARMKHELNEGDNIILYTGWSRYNWENERDDEKYFCRCPGPDLSVTEWFIEKKINWCGIDAPSFEHPMNTAIRDYRPDLAQECARKAGYNDIEEYMPRETWMLHCHKRMMRNGQMHVDNIGGDVAQLVGQKVIVGVFPWRWVTGDASIARVVAFVKE